MAWQRPSRVAELLLAERGAPRQTYVSGSPAETNAVQGAVII